MAKRLTPIRSATNDARAQIIDVICAVGLCVDVREFAAVRALFAPDGTLTYNGLPGVASVPVPAATFWDQVMQFLPGFDSTFHQITNFDIQLSGEAATSRALVFAVHRLDDQLMQQGGLYEHQMVKLPAGWRIRNQTYTKYWGLGADLIPAAAARVAAQAKG